MHIAQVVRNLPGPILIIGASGFLGANLFRTILKYRNDVYGTIFGQKAWRLERIPSQNTIFLDLLSSESQVDVLTKIRPATIFNCSAYGAYSFEKNWDKIHQTNYNSTITLLENLANFPVKAYIHAGSSSEYGLNCNAPKENDLLIPDSHYAISKGATALAIKHFGKVKEIPCANMRLYSLYGPYEDSSRLIPVLAEKILQKTLPSFVSSETSRDFIYVDDVVNAFITVAANIKQSHFGESFNIGTGSKTTIKELAELSCRKFNLDVIPEYGTMSGRMWDHQEWCSDPRLMKKEFGWKASITLEEGLSKTVAWWKEFLQSHNIKSLTKNNASQKKSSITAIIACYKDYDAIPIMYNRLKDVFTKIDVDYEIIFVNDCSPDDTTEQIKKITRVDSNVIGIVHSRNFGSQSAFRSGMAIASKEACVLLDGDLQDPPELIEQFYEKWKSGVDIVYGRRVRREMPTWLDLLYKTFYYIFASLSEIKIPRNAGDFSLIDNRAVRWILKCDERDAFLRGLRAYVGFKQEGVDYIRPDRMFGRSTNNVLKNIGWAKKAIFSFSRAPLHLLTTIGFCATVCSSLFGIFIVLCKFIAPEHIPHGITTISLLIIIFGSVNLLGLGLLGEYLGKIIEEVKGRPSYIRTERIQHGKVIAWEEK
jgi:polyisoprenyl-phosphate glycosyltransferase